MTDLAAVVEHLLGGDLGFVADFPLGAATTYRVGGAAAIGVVVDSPEHLARVGAALATAQDRHGAVPLLVVGRGSNLLVADAGFAGVACRLGESFEAVFFDGRPTVRAGGAASLPVVARRTVGEGLQGFEWAVGVPGSIGGAVRMNAGGHGSDMAASVSTVRVVDLRSGKDFVMDATECRFGYRTSAIEPHHVVVEVELHLEEGDPARGESELSEIVRWRRHHQPGGQNAGSVFANPPGDSAGRLIDIAGCKGLRIGSASVSNKHANFIQADLGGSADDIAALMAAVRERVAEHSGVTLHAETVMAGFEQVAMAAAGAR